MDYDIEKADNGYITKQDKGTGYKNNHRVFTSFENLVEDMAFFFGVVKIGERYHDKVLKEELGKEQNTAR